MCKITEFERELIIRGMAEQTIRCYLSAFKMFLEYFSDSDIRYLSIDSIKNYILELNKFYGYNKIAHSVYSIKFYYKNINSRKREFDLPLPKKCKHIPSVLSKDEIIKILSNIDNLKHRCIIETIYTHGLRRQELIDLKLTDIDSGNMEICIKNSKGAKDRNIPLNKGCLENLRKYYREYNPKKYLFEGYAKENKYSATSISNILKNACKLSGITKYVTIHTLRHSFASYLVSININLRKIQEWLGHNSPLTTQIYTHILHEDNPIILKVA